MASPAHHRLPDKYRVRRTAAEEAVLLEISTQWGVPVVEIIHGGQQRNTVAARRAACLRFRALGYSLKQIGKILGGMHYTSILYHVGPKPAAVPPVPAPCPDLSGEWAI
jgi:chromosomal replication initiation ATPase DnaA